MYCARRVRRCDPQFSFVPFSHTITVQTCGAFTLSRLFLLGGGGGGGVDPSIELCFMHREKVNSRQEDNDDNSGLIDHKDVREAHCLKTKHLFEFQSSLVLTSVLHV